MADLDLSIVVRARDLLTAELKRMGTSIQELSRIGKAAFAQVDASPIAASIRTTEAAIRSLGAASVSLKPLEDAIELAGKQLEDLRAHAARAGGQLSALDRQKLDQLEREVREGEVALTRFRAAGDRAAVGLGTSFKAAGAAVRSALLPILPLLTLGGAAFAAADSVRQAAEFEKALAGISAEAGITGVALDQLKQQALETTRALGISEAKAAPALLKAITDGSTDAADGLSIFSAAARLASATSGDLTRTVDVLNSVLNAFREQGLDAAEAADVLFTTAVRGGKLDVDELAGGIGAVLPLVQGMGISFQELSAVIIASTKAGGGFQQGMQAVRGVLGVLTGDNEAAAEALRGIDFSGARIRAEGLVPVLRDIAARLGDDSAAIRKVFPDARSFGVVLSLLKDDGRRLTEELGHLRNAAGGVENALGRRLQNPAEQLGIVINRVRSEFAQAFGGAFFASVGRAVGEMGGLESASDRVAVTAREIGKALGEAIPPAIELLKQLTQAAGEFAKALDDINFEQFSRAGVVYIRAVAESLGTVADLMGALGEFTFGGFDFTLLSDRVKSEIAELDEDLGSIFAKPRTVEVHARGLDEVTGLFAIAQSNAANFSKELEDIAPRVRAAVAEFENFGDPEAVRAVISELNALRRGLEDTTSSMDELDVELLGLRKERIEEIRAELLTLGENVKRVTDQARELEIIDPAQVDAFLAANGLILSEIEKRKAALVAERAALQSEVLEISVKAKIDKPDPRTIGFAIQGAIDAALELVDPGAVTRLTDAIKEAVERGDTITAEALFSRREQNELRLRARQAASAVVGEFSTFEDAATLIRQSFDVPPGAENFKELLRDEALEGHELVNVLAELLVSRGRDIRSLGDVRRALLEVSDAQVRAAVSARGAEIEAKRYLAAVTDLPSSLTTEIILFGIDAAVRGLAELARERESLEGTALALNIEIEGLDPEQAREKIERAQAQLSRDAIAISFGFDIKVDDRTLAQAIEKAEAAVERAQAEIGRAAQEREAFRFGVSLDTTTLEADILRAREKFQAAADRLDAFNVETEAIALRIEIDDKSPAQLEQEIKEVQARLQRFAAENPITFGAINIAADSLSTALADIASGTKSAKDAFEDFARSFLRDITKMITQQLIFNALQNSGIFGAAQGAVVAARGVAFGDEPGMAVRYALGGVPRAHTEAVPFALGVPDALRTLSTDVAPFAAGGAPDLVRHLWTEVQPYAAGGSPYLDRIVDRPTIASAESFAGSAIVPLSGGGVTTPDGRKLPVVKQHGELVVQRFARGGFDVMFGEAGEEGVMRTVRSASGRLGLRASDGGVLPFFRDSSRRLGVVPFAAGGVPYQTGGAFSEPRASSSLQISIPISIAMQRDDHEARRVASAFQEPRAREQIEAAVLDVIRRSGTYRAEVRGDRVS